MYFLSTCATNQWGFTSLIGEHLGVVNMVTLEIVGLLLGTHKWGTESSPKVLLFLT